MIKSITLKGELARSITRAASQQADLDATERSAFLDRQKSLLDKCYPGESPRNSTVEEKMLIQVIQHDARLSQREEYV